jgi:REP element-mobilizing transposase RayT
VNLRRALVPLGEGEYGRVTDARAAARRKRGFLLCAYVVMPDHGHALLGTTLPLTIWRAVQDIQWTSAGSLNRVRRAQGTVGQHQFWDRFVRHRKEFGPRLDAMHLNPLRQGWVSRPQDWRGSSDNNFGLDKVAVAECPIQIDDVPLPESYRG